MGLLKKEDIAAYLEKNDAAEFEINTVDEFNTLKENILENGVSEQIGDKISALHTQYDNDIFEITGLKKEPNQKTYDFNKKVLGDLKADKAEHETLKTKFTELEKTKGKGDKNLADELQQVKDKALLEKEGYDKEIAKLKSTGFDTQKKFTISGAIAGLKFNETIPESVRQTYIDNAEKELIANSELREGKLVFLKDDKVELGKDYEVKGVNDKVAEQLADILAKGKPGLGLNKDNKDQQEIILPDHVKTPDGLVAHMKTLPGLEMYSKEWNDMFKALSKNFK